MNLIVTLTILGWGEQSSKRTIVYYVLGTLVYSKQTPILLWVKFSIILMYWVIPSRWDCTALAKGATNSWLALGGTGGSNRSQPCLPGATSGGSRRVVLLTSIWTSVTFLPEELRQIWRQIRIPLEKLHSRAHFWQVCLLYTNVH